jgi:putative transposase
LRPCESLFDSDRPENAPSAREAWFDGQLDLDPETLGFVDETGASTKMSRRYGRVLCAEVGYPASIRVDQGSKFISRDLDLWKCTRGVTLDSSRLGKPTDDAFIETFNSKFRAECLNQHWFMSLDDAVRKCEAWRRDYNEVRLHSAIGNKTPISLANPSAAHGPPLPANAGRRPTGWSKNG